MISSEEKFIISAATLTVSIPRGVADVLHRRAEEKGVTLRSILRASIALILREIESLEDEEKRKRVVYLSDDITIHKFKGGKGHYPASTKVTHDAYVHIDSLCNSLMVTRSTLMRAGIALFLQRDPSAEEIRELEKVLKGVGK